MASEPKTFDFTSNNQATKKSRVFKLRVRGDLLP